MNKDLIERLPVTLGGSIGGAFGAACAGMATNAARHHGVDLGVLITEEAMGTVALASAFIGDAVAVWMMNARVKRAIRRQATHLRKRAGAIADPQVRSRVRECIDIARADWDAGFLTDDIMRDRFLDEIYLRYISPLDVGIAPVDAGRLIPSNRQAAHAAPIQEDR